MRRTKRSTAWCLSGLALAFSRLIDNSVVVLENIFRHLEMGEIPRSPPSRARTKSALAVLAITLVTVVVFFPVTLLFGVSKYLFTALALGVVIALFASYFVAVSVVPLFCANFLRGHRAPRRKGRRAPSSPGAARFHAAFNAQIRDAC